MASKIDICYAFLEANSEEIPTTNLRGFLGYMFVNDPEFHHHSESSYHYPLVQYKKIKDRLLVLGLNEYAKHVFERISNLDKVIAEKEKYKISSVELSRQSFEVCQQECEYEFLSPWIALNKKNYETFKDIASDERIAFLENIFTGNILSALKGLGIRADFRIETRIKDAASIQTEVHGNKFEGFAAQVLTNVALPNYIGIGKSVSKGLGVLNRIQSN